MAKEYSNPWATCVVAENRTNNMMRVKLGRTKCKEWILCHTHVIVPSKGCFFAFCLIIDAANNNILIGLFIFIHLHRTGDVHACYHIKKRKNVLQKIVKRIVHTRYTQFNYVHYSARRRWILLSSVVCTSGVLWKNCGVCALHCPNERACCNKWTERERMTPNNG